MFHEHLANPWIYSVIFLGFLIYSAVVYHQFRKGLLDAELGMGSQSKGSH